MWKWSKEDCGIVSATSEASSNAWIVTECHRVLKRSDSQGMLESRMLGNSHVRFGVGAGVKSPAYTTSVPKSAIDARGAIDHAYRGLAS